MVHDFPFRVHVRVEKGGVVEGDGNKTRRSGGIHIRTREVQKRKAEQPHRNEGVDSPCQRDITLGDQGVSPALMEQDLLPARTQKRHAMRNQKREESGVKWMCLPQCILPIANAKGHRRDARRGKRIRKIKSKLSAAPVYTPLHRSL